MLRIGAAISLLFALYLLLVGSVHPDELVAGVLSALAAVAASLAMSHGASRSFDFHRVPWPWLVGRSLLSVAVDMPKVSLRLARGAISPGTTQRWPVADGNDSPAAAAHRALIVLAASLAPNSYVLTLQSECGEMRVHRLVPAAPPADPEWPL